MCHSPIRRRLLAALALSPLAAALAACGKNSWPEGMAEIKWDRDTCSRCRMVISDRRFACEVRGGPKDEVVKFDDIGCALVWLKAQPWAREARLWVADAGSRNEQLNWLDARQARYLGGKTSPMGYGFAAYGQAPGNSLDFSAIEAQVLAGDK